MAENGMADAFPGASGRTPAEIERDLAISTLVDLRLLHAGRAASLFRAHQVPTRRTVAVKVLHDELSSDVGQRFDRERAITGQLSGHTGIVPLFDTGTTADGEPFLIMPYYRRGSLADLMTRYGPLAWQEATFLLEPVAVSLAEVHGRELVHRNIKPGNILLTDFLLPRVADFGMCLPKGQISTKATLVENADYSPPETAEPAESDPAIDVFGLGATLWGLLSGHKPAAVEHNRQAPTIVPQSLAHRPPGRAIPDPLPSSTPTPIADLIQRSMAPDPADRPPNAAAFVTELRRAVSLAGQPAGSGKAASSDGSALIQRLEGEPVLDPAQQALSDGSAGPNIGPGAVGSGDAHADTGSGTGTGDSGGDSTDLSGVGDIRLSREPKGHDQPVGGGVGPGRKQSLAQLHDRAADTVDDAVDDKAAAGSRAPTGARSTTADPETDAELGRSGFRSAQPEKASSELYLLVLVALISTGILVMLAAAVLAVN